MKYVPFNRSRKQDVEAPGQGHPLSKGVLAAVLLGGFLGAAAAFFTRKEFLALGILLGSSLSLPHFYSLHALSGKVLRAGHKGGKIFWFFSFLRWALVALVCWALVSLSPSCLLGALAGYLWALAVLGWNGWRNSFSPKPSHRA